MIEPYVNARELTVGVLEEEGTTKPIEVTEIISDNNFYDYEAKYTKGISKHILPALVPFKIYNDCLSNAKIIHEILGCKGVSRSDFILGNNELYFIEINSQPGLTPISLVPEQLKYQNVSFDNLILQIILE